MVDGGSPMESPTSLWAMATRVIESIRRTTCLPRSRKYSAAAVAACETTAQAALKAGIERWSAAIRKRLDARERLLFERNASAWKVFFDSEVALLDLGLGKRADGLASKLRPGAITRLYEQREEQLREHLHNLSIPGP